MSRPDLQWKNSWTYLQQLSAQCQNADVLSLVYYISITHNPAVNGVSSSTENQTQAKPLSHMGFLQ